MNDGDVVQHSTAMRVGNYLDNPIHSTPSDTPVALKACAGPMSALQVSFDCLFDLCSSRKTVMGMRFVGTVAMLTATIGFRHAKL
jgi:hypothetical protein